VHRAGDGAAKDDGVSAVRAMRCGMRLSAQSRTFARSLRNTADHLGRPCRSKLVIVQGKVKFFNQDRGFGFIAREGGADVFVHVSNVQGNGTPTLVEGQSVEFDIGQGRKSEEARNVRVI
jgi:cold shock protein